MRADAARRRQTIVREARRLFAAHGGGIALEAIAEASGVGIATLYRNFDSRLALAEEVALAILSDIRDASATALAAIPENPAAGWRAYLDRLVELDLGALVDGLADLVADGLPERVREMHEETLAAVDEVVAAARAHGEVSSPLRGIELAALIGMVTRHQPEAVHRTAPDLVPHLLDILVAGMRAAPPSR